MLTSLSAQTVDKDVFYCQSHRAAKTVFEGEEGKKCEISVSKLYCALGSLS